MIIDKKYLGGSKPLYFIADIAANHDGDLNRALKLIELAKEAGADAAKFQNFQANRIVSKFGFENLGGQLSHQKSWKKSVYEVYEDASISFDWTPILKEKCDQVGIDYFTSPYDFESVDLVENFVDVYKIGSGDITWTEIIEYISKKNKIVLIAAGASNMEDVQRAMKIIEQHTQEIVLMQCNTNYTASLENFHYVNLSVLNGFKTQFPNVVLGLSDHTSGHSTVLGAIALGARVFEKHFTDDNFRDGPDHKFAMNPESWKEMVNNSYELYHALGDGIKRIEDNELDASIVQRRSIRAKQNLKLGTILSESDFECLRPMPSDGLHPYEMEKIIGKQLVVNLSQGEQITLKHIK
jgi:N-acetylneuraminate synthase